MTQAQDQTEAQLEDAENGLRRTGATVVSGAQDVAEMARVTVERAAARLPEAVAGAQVAARDTQRTLESMPNQALIIGTSFSLGLGIGLFVSGANRLLVALALAPAGAMAVTFMGRDEGSLDSSSSSSASRRSNARAQ